MASLVESLSHRFNKNQLANKYLDEKTAKESAIKRLEEVTAKYKEELAKKDRELHELKKTTDYWGTDDFIIKKILEMRAKGLSPTIIRKKLELMDIDITSDHIMNVLQSELSPSHEAYFKEQELIFIDSLKINTDLLKHSSIDTLRTLKDYAFLNLEKMMNEGEEPKALKEIRQEIGSYESQISKLVLGIDENTKLDVQDEMLEKETKNYIDRVDKMINLGSLGDIVVVGKKDES